MLFDLIIFLVVKYLVICFPEYVIVVGLRALVFFRQGCKLFADNTCCLLQLCSAGSGLRFLPGRVPPEQSTDFLQISKFTTVLRFSSDKDYPPVICVLCAWDTARTANVLMHVASRVSSTVVVVRDASHMSAWNPESFTDNITTAYKWTLQNRPHKSGRPQIIGAGFAFTMITRAIYHWSPEIIPSAIVGLAPFVGWASREIDLNNLCRAMDDVSSVLPLIYTFSRTSPSSIGSLPPIYMLRSRHDVWSDHVEAYLTSLARCNVPVTSRTVNSVSEEVLLNLETWMRNYFTTSPVISHKRCPSIDSFSTIAPSPRAGHSFYQNNESGASQFMSLAGGRDLGTPPP
eukprot:PhF_6_TR14199/c0_g1_i1/m.22744